MLSIIKRICLFFLLTYGCACLASPSQVIKVVAAENFYGDIAKKIGGKYVEVFSILSHPNQDPHLFQLSPSVVKASVEADLIIYNGIGYDTWVKSLFASSKAQTVIEVASLLDKSMGDNPHIWYAPLTMPILAKKLTLILSQKDPQHIKYYKGNLEHFSSQYQKILNHIKTMKAKYDHFPLLATEPVFNEMAKAIGLQVYGEAFQLSIMNDITPTPSQIREVEQIIRRRLVAVLIYNKQVQNPTTERLKKLAEKYHIPVLGITETQPIGKDYIDWINEELTALEKALSTAILKRAHS